MKKNLLKKIVAVVATTAFALTAVLANPTVAKAATDKVVYLEVEEDGAYTIGLWSGFTGVTVNADMDDWTYKFTKVEDGLYMVSVSVDEAALTGLQIYKDGNEIAKSDSQWSTDGGVFNTALQDALNSDDTIITISSYDSTNWNFSKVETSSESDDTTPATPKTGDMTAVLPVAVLAVAAMAVVVAMKKKAVAE